MLKNNQLLKKMIYHAYGTVPFYQCLIDDNNIDIELTEIDKLPIVDKEFVVKSGKSMLSSQYIGKYIADLLIWTRTSGSSGFLHEIYWDNEDEKKSLKSLWLLRWKYYRISPKQKLCYFFPSDVESEKYIENGTFLAVSRSVLYDGSIEEAYQRIKQYKPEWMILQPSIAVILCDLAEEYGIWENLNYIEFTGEYLEQPVRERVKTIFGCKTANQYGTKEVNSIAYECPEGKLHVMSDNVYLETIEGNMCVTSLCNYAMPFIRYKLDDRGEILKGVSCKCGKCGDIVTLKAGRSNDLIRLSDGSTMHAYALMQVIHHINYHYDGCIMQYQIVQTDYSDFVFKLVLLEDEYDEELRTVIVETIKKEVEGRLKVYCKIDVIFMDTILPDK